MNIRKYHKLIISMLILLVFGFSYAYFSASDETEKQTVSTGKLSFSFDDSTEIINATNIIPITQEKIDTKATKKHFSITNTGTQNMYIRINIEDITMDEELKNKYFRFALYDSGERVSLGTFDKTTTEQLIKQNVLFEKNVTKDYDLYIWIEDNKKEQNEMMDKEFNGKIVITGLANETINEQLVTNTNATTIITSEFKCESCENPLSDMLDLSYLTNLNTINAESFKGNNITSIDLPISLTSLSGFQNNQINGELDLSYLTNLTSLGSYTFDTNQITSVKLPYSLTTISSNAFYFNQISGELDLSYLTNLTSISPNAFKYNQISCVKLPESLTLESVSLAFDSGVIECNN